MGGSFSRDASTNVNADAVHTTDTAYNSEEELGAFMYRSSLAAKVQANENEVNEQAPTERHNGGSLKETMSDGTPAKESHANEEDAFVSMNRKRPGTESSESVKRIGKSRKKDTNTPRRVGPMRAAKKKSLTAEETICLEEFGEVTGK